MWRTVGGKKSDFWARAKIRKEVKSRLRRLYEINSWHITGYPITQCYHFDIFEAEKLDFDEFWQFLRDEISQNQNWEPLKLQKW